jgi:cytochrome d ubiquinol oxidase subunit II
LSLPELCGAIILLTITAYAVLGGADYGGGVLDLFARGSRAKGQRSAIAKQMGPVWEANHVWLIFALVGLFTAFPEAYQGLAVAMYLPLLLALVGIVARGVAFAFRGYVESETVSYNRFSRVFGIASVITPFLFGAVAGGLASADRGDIAYDGRDVDTDGVLALWTEPFALLVGALALNICAYLAATFMTVDMRRLGEHELAEDFRRRALVAGAIAGVASLAGVIATDAAADRLHDRLLDEALPLMRVGLAAGAGSLGAMWLRRYALARVCAVGAVAAVIAGWGVAQSPWLVGPDLTLDSAAASETMQVGFVITAGAGLLLMLPCLYLLFVMFRRAPAKVEGT